MIFDEPDLMIEAAVDGLGVAYVLEHDAAGRIVTERLVRMLEDWTPPFSDRRGQRRRQAPAGAASGSSENAEVVKDLLNGLIERRLPSGRDSLLVIDGFKALRAAIEAVFGKRAHEQRCRTHKMRDVTDRLTKEVVSRVSAVMKAASRCQKKRGWRN
ncbi:Mobile element protein [Caballeronia sordidicola]|uniref:Mobile element protein n=1 Tax=Caballeronia sordidicola TaxID=196367 RepID=A0A226WUI5_CABSO|nr:Mobile element protein [Caballeronia sordidicola]